MFGCSKREEVTEKDVEYRKNDVGNLILYRLGESMPFATGAVGQVNGFFMTKVILNDSPSVFLTG